MDAVPVYLQDVEWTGEGPSRGNGNALSDAIWGQNEAISGPPSIVPVAAYALPYAPHHVDFSGPSLYPGGHIDGLRTPAEAHYQLRDASTHTPYTMVDSGLDLGAPSINTGDQNLGGRP